MHQNQALKTLYFCLPDRLMFDSLLSAFPLNVVFVQSMWKTKTKTQTSASTVTVKPKTANSLFLAKISKAGKKQKVEPLDFSRPAWLDLNRAKTISATSASTSAPASTPTPTPESTKTSMAASSSSTSDVKSDVKSDVQNKLKRKLEEVQATQPATGRIAMKLLVLKTLLDQDDSSNHEQDDGVDPILPLASTVPIPSVKRLKT